MNPCPSIRSQRATGRLSTLSAIAVAIGLLWPGRGDGASVTLRPSKDNTLYGDASLSNGAGAYLFAGSSGEKRTLRSLVAFDFDGQIPAGAAINSASLTLAINTPLAANSNTVRLHRVLADWGEGGSNAPMGGGGGAPATAGDATWNVRFSDGAAWTTPGGDFASAPSATATVRGASGSATFSAAGLTADVQAWANTPAANFGWILVAQDELGPAVRFSSREGAAAPLLVVDFTVPTGGGNTAPAITSQPGNQIVAAGATVTFAVAASGTPGPTFQWRKDGTAIAGATQATLTLVSVAARDAGSYTVAATNAAGSVTSAVATLAVEASSNPNAARLSNLSVRAALAAEQTLFVGFSVAGGSRSVLVRGVGPTLAGFGLEGTMADPRLELYHGSTLVSRNDDWGGSSELSGAFGRVGAFGLVAGGRDAALLQSVDGTRSVQARGTGAGVILVELYDTGTGQSPRLVNVSARNHVGVGDTILILGFYVEGTGTKNVLIRAVGPRLGDLGVTGTLADPKLDVFRSGSAVAVASNDNWDSSLAATFNAVGAFGLAAGSKDAALVTTLTPGAYTVQVAGVNNGTGEALVEIYEVP